jgi:hypothetical protein
MGRSHGTLKKTGRKTLHHTSEASFDCVDVKTSFANLCMLLKVVDIESPNRIVSVKVNHHNIDEASLFKTGYSECSFMEIFGSSVTNVKFGVLDIIVNNIVLVAWQWAEDSKPSAATTVTCSTC